MIFQRKLINFEAKSRQKQKKLLVNSNFFFFSHFSLNKTMTLQPDSVHLLYLNFRGD